MTDEIPGEKRTRQLALEQMAERVRKWARENGETALDNVPLEEIVACVEIWAKKKSMQ